MFHCCLLKPFQFQSTTIDPGLELPALLEDNQPLTILDTKWEQTASGRQLPVLVQWTGLLPEDTSWEKWENLKKDYNLEDKVVLEARRDVMNEDTEQDATTEHEAEAREEGQKGKLVSPSTLRIMQQNEAELAMIF